MIKKIVTFLLQLLLICFLSLIAREAWTAYEQEKLNVLFAKEAVPVRIQVGTVNTEKKTWKDYIGNSKYIGFSYRSKEYNLRILQDSGWVGAGSGLWLQYHQALDQFRQPGILYHRVPNRQVSKLIKWTILSIASPAHRMLFAAVALTFIIILMCCSILANITGIGFFTIISRGLVTVFFMGAGVFATWDSWANYQYYRQLKNGVTLTLPVLQKDKVTEHRSNCDHMPFYYYTATVSYPQMRREIMISSEDYDRLTVGDQLQVLYNAAPDDMVAADYTPGYGRIAFIVVLWIIIVYLVMKPNKTTASSY